MFSGNRLSDSDSLSRHLSEQRSSTLSGPDIYVQAAPALQFVQDNRLEIRRVSYLLLDGEWRSCA